ncbi:YqhR family membrane protein [Halobacillus salinarum]|uniref:YqhR family membrane protein n=1 Tax=Halobacillus salinarum TaxID=2932257 RepID=A0ABY4EDM1_9BACI|nr:YqhR family membrane protein [Halobacillus salinarum]UOQ42549.1 YqhR family membrane protein [Halobacillus salinarum]
MSDKTHEQNKKEPAQSVLSKSLLIGFVAGALWGAIGVLAYYFHFTQISAASFIFRSYFQTSWTGTWLGEVLAVIVVALLSIITAFIYYMCLKRKNGMWPGVFLAVTLFVLIFVILDPLFPAVPGIMDLSSDTLVTTGCLFLLYGVFIGYSISYEYNQFNHSANNYSKEG